jgi:hypothetical protein
MRSRSAGGGGGREAAVVVVDEPISEVRRLNAGEEDGEEFKTFSAPNASAAAAGVKELSWQRRVGMFGKRARDVERRRRIIAGEEEAEPGDLANPMEVELTLIGILVSLTFVFLVMHMASGAYNSGGFCDCGSRCGNDSLIVMSPYDRSAFGIICNTLTRLLNITGTIADIYKQRPKIGRRQLQQPQEEGERTVKPGDSFCPKMRRSLEFMITRALETFLDRNYTVILYGKSSKLSGTINFEKSALPPPPMVNREEEEEEEEEEKEPTTAAAAAAAADGS